MTFRLAHSNVCEPDSALQTAQTIHAVLARADVATFNEANDPDTHHLLDLAHGWDAYAPAHGAAREDCIAWRPDVFDFLLGGTRVVMRGGIVAGRRRGPSRAVSWVLLRERSTGAVVFVATHHDAAKGRTTQRWRWPLVLAGFRHVAAELATARRAHPGAALILTGDLNTTGPVRFPGTGLREVRTPPTYGRKRYDRILATPGVIVRDVRAFTTKSDHLALAATVTLPKEGS